MAFQSADCFGRYLPVSDCVFLPVSVFVIQKYALPAWPYGLPATVSKKIENDKRRALRFILGINYFLVQTMYSAGPTNTSHAENNYLLTSLNHLSSRSCTDTYYHSH